jgi:hypothetical protein
MIKVKTNKNIVFFFFLFNLISKTKNIQHPLGKSLMERFSNLPKEVEKLQEQYTKNEIPKHPYQYCTLAINTDDKLKAKTLSPNYDYGEETFVKALTHFLLTNIYKPFIPLEESEKKENEILEKIVEDGYIHAPEFYRELKEGKEPIGVYMGVVGELKG